MTPTHKFLLSKASFLVMPVFILFLQCNKREDPEPENAPETITKVELIFNLEKGKSITVIAEDPDGNGTGNLVIKDSIRLVSNATYILNIKLFNGLVSFPNDPANIVSDEVAEEGKDHWFYFSWTKDIFSDPPGDGNIDNRDDSVLYTGGEYSVDENNKPLGLTTTWKTGNPAKGNFRVLLKHIPGLDKDKIDSNEGETDLDITFGLTVE